jgi:hypothetical protein
MTIKCIYTCNHCKAVSDEEHSYILPKGWRKLDIRLGHYTQLKQEFHLCDTCAPKLEKEEEESYADAGTRIHQIIQEIIDDTLENAQP